jgi:predicted nucleotide-binding protein
MESTIKQLELLIEKGQSFTFQNFCYPHGAGQQYGGDDTAEWLAWKTRSHNFVRQLTADNSTTAKMVDVAVKITTEGNYSKDFERAKSTILKALRLTLDATKEDAFNELRRSGPRSTSHSLSNKIFVVHGHDHTLKTEVETFLYDIGLDPVVLHRKPDEGATVIEKFEKHSDVGYAFILLTPDEVAYAIDEEDKEDEKREKEKRARPNVIFEFGYFVGKLSRKRVCCLYKGDVTLPSDLSGLVYKKLDGPLESQKFSLVKELKAAGYQIKI